MGKQGPCYHCGVTNTPLWRNGPPDKPVLCNACGSRWRTKGTLANYTPLHARAEPDEFEDYRVSRARNISTKNKEKKLIKRKLNDDIGVLGGVGPDFDQGIHKGIDEDNSNRSSSGSAMSNSDSCVHFSSADASDLTGPSQSIVWDTTIPSRKRTCVSRSKTSSSAVEKLTKDLYTILHEQQSSHYSGSCEEDLLFECDKPMVSVEIGHGSVLIRHPSYIPKEEESVASSPSIDNKLYRENEAYSRLNALPVYNKGVPILGIEKSRKTNGLGMQQEQTRREKSQRETLQILENHNSPLCCVDLNDILNFDEFARVLTNEEQHKLFMYLHSTDTAKLPDSLNSMFASPQFKEDVSCFQKLLAEGVFDLSFSGVKAENCMTLKRLALCDSAKSDWVEQYNLLKEIKCKKNNEGSVVHGGPNIIPSGYSTNVKRSREGQFQRFPGVKSTIKSPKRMMKGNYEHKELIDNDGTCFSPKSLFVSPNNSSPMFDSFRYMDESSDQDMLLEVPSNGSFPEAELLLPTSNFGAQASTSSSSIHPQLIQP